MNRQLRQTKFADWHFPAMMAGLLLVSLSVMMPSSVQAKERLTDDELTEIAVEAYFYAYPIVIMDVTRQVSTNCETASGAKMCAPMNQFAHVPVFPDAKFTDVVRPNADTLYSVLWFDVTQEPLVIHVPDSGGRYYLLPMLDMWSDVFACPGKRTSGTGEQTIAIVGPRWKGQLPKGLDVRRSPTGMGWIIGRTQTNGKADFDNVHKFQAALKAVPLSAWGKDYATPKGKVDRKVSSDPPSNQVARMDAAEFFGRFAELTKDNPPHPNDYPIRARMRRIGLVPGKTFDFAKAPPRVQAALKKAVTIAQKRLSVGLTNVGTIVNNWGMILSPIGTYGTDYYRRALIAYGGLGANVIEDAIYPTAFVDANGKPFDSEKKYVIHFAKDEIPPVRAFWSLTMYNDKQAFADNPINRYAIGDRDKLKFNHDGSLTLFIQRESPGKDKESNWLPAPKSGGFSMNLRLYWPKPEALNGTWKAPAVRTGDETAWTIGPRTLPVPRDVSRVFRDSLLKTPTPDVAAMKKLRLKNDQDFEAFAKSGDERQAAAAVALAKKLDVEIKTDTLGGVNIHWVTPPKVDPKHKKHLFVFIHGGAFVRNSGLSGTIEAILIASRLKMPVVSIDYRLLPKHPAPAATDDVISVWKALLKQHSPDSMIMGGTSAGGNITLSSVIRFKEQGLRLPGALYIGTPCCDLSPGGDSRFLNVGVDRLLITWDHYGNDAAVKYAGKYDLKHPHVSPIYGDFKNLPPSYLISGTRDLLLSDTVRLHRRLRRSGVEADLHVYEGQSHGDYLFVMDSPESLEHFSELNAFILKHLGE
jgi:acetyl esterase/lipase